MSSSVPSSEFLGPLVVAVVGSRRLADLVWAGLAATGVALLGLTPGRLDPRGIAYALLAGAAWAGYILLGARTGRRWERIGGLAVASVLVTVVITPPALMQDARLTPAVVLTGIAVGLLSSVIPYSLELHALRWIPPKVFGILMSLEPAVAAAAAFLLLGERLTWVELVAMACVVGASVGSTRTS